MKGRYFVGGASVIVGVFWISAFTFFLLTSVLPVQLMHPNIWSEQVYLPAASVSTILYVVLLTCWIFFTTRQRCDSSAEARGYLGLWFTLFGVSWLCNIITLILFIQLTTVVYPANLTTAQGTAFVQFPPYEYLVPLTFINALLLFWLPSVFLSQRTLRFIPPFSYTLCSITEKR